MNAFFSKIRTWIIAHKVVSIVVASVLVVGIVCAVALPIALHEHSYAADWSSDADNHWHDASCKHKEEKSDLAAHTYTNACDTTCDVCGYTRTVGAHVYDNACDTSCNVCSAERTVDPHVYDNACDTACNVCGATRTITHDHADTLTAGDTTHWYACSVCGDKKDEAAHVFDQTVASSEYLKAEATATTKAQYYKSCVCGKASATEYFETDKEPANLQVSDISKTYDGTPVAEPTVTFDGVGAENFAYYKGDERLTERPTDAGTYKVVVTVEETETHAGDRVEKEFTIAKKVLSNLTFSVVYNGSTYHAGVAIPSGVVAGDEFLVDIDLYNKNVGTYTCPAAGKETSVCWEDITPDGADYQNYEVDHATATVTVTPKTLNYLELTKVYNGKRGFGENAGLYCQLGVEHGVIEGDTVFLETSDDVEYNVGKYYFVRMNSTDDRDTVWLVGDDKANYDFCGDDVVGEVTVTKRPVWAEDVKFTYDGENRFYGDYATSEIVFQNVVAGETINACDIVFKFDNKNVGSGLIAVGYDVGITGNYELDFSKCSASIVPRELDVSGLSSSFVYKYNEHQHNIQIPGLIKGENLTYHVNFRSKNVGSDPLYYGFLVNNSASTKEETLLNYKPSGYADWSEWGLEMYNNAEITPVLVEFPELITKEYDQTADFTFAISDISVQNVTVSLKAVDADENALTDAGEYMGCNARSVVFYIDGTQTNNYAFVETEGVVNVTITPKQLNFNTLYFNYPPSYYYTSLEIRLGTAVGVYEGDVVRLFANFKNTPANNSAITLDTASTIHLYAENNAKINKNYVLPEDKSTITVYTSTFDYITIDPETLKGTYTVDSDFTDCILLVNIPTTGGYIFSSTENFMTDNLYDANGNIMKESTNTPGNYGLEAGTYYWQVSVNSTPLGTLNVEKNIPTGAKEKPHAITYNANKFTAEDSHVDWSIADEYYYKVFLIQGTYTVSQKGLKISVFDTSWNTVANLTDKFTISTIGTYYVYISKGDNADVYDTITKFTLVNDLLLDGNADFMSDSMYEQGVLVSEDYDVTNGQIISFCFDPVYNITDIYSFELISDTKSFGNLVASYRFYDSDFRAVDITWDGSQLTFPSGYTEQDALYIVVQFKVADTGVYLRAE